MIEDYKKAGRIAAQALDYGARMIKPGASLLEVSDLVEKKIIDLGGEIAFPTQISLNQVAAHNCADPDDKTVFKEGDLVKIDVGAHVNGFVGDTARTVDLGNHKDIVKASEEALANAIKVLRPGITLREIGKEIQETIQKYSLSPVRNLCGHGLGKFNIHDKPSIPNYDNGDSTSLKEGQAIAIEPFATDGVGMIYESSPANIFMLTNKKPVRNSITREILKLIESYNGLPFTTRWLVRKYPVFKVKFALRDLLNNRIIRDYPPLPEKRGFVAQTEHTVIIKDKPIITTMLDN
ncbi:type II methionyl aminopeptidase [Candidatus Woesearchaeota archaeon]|nr:MAG: type II methionyl aminopeptidase [Candidatus Woesearchaeota archaeon]